MPKQYDGFFPENKTISQWVHGGDAVDVGDCTWGTMAYYAWRSDLQTKRKFVVVRSNSVDTNASNVRYSAYQDITGDSEAIIFGFFHTDICPHKVGEVHYSGEQFVKNAKNGVTFGAHFHLVTRFPEFKNKVNPLPWLKIVDNKLIGRNPNPPQAQPMNIPANSILEVITTKKLRVRQLPNVSSPIVRELDPGTKLKTTIGNPQNSIADGYEWTHIDGGYIAVQVMSSGEKWVKLYSQTPEERIKELEAQLIVANSRAEKAENELRVQANKLTIARTGLADVVLVAQKALSES